MTLMSFLKLCQAVSLEKEKKKKNKRNGVSDGIV